jgi:hypothetical protein
VKYSFNMSVLPALSKAPYQQTIDQLLQPVGPIQSLVGPLHDHHNVGNALGPNNGHPVNALRINKERIVSPAARKTKTKSWSSWVAEERYQDGLQRESYVKDQTVILPGKLPAPPLYGPSREIQLKVGNSMPTIYSQRLTPTDIQKLVDENQSLRNKLLDRMTLCQICDAEFREFDKEQIRDHIQQHVDQLKEVGRCPCCSDSQWAFMTADEKKSHLLIHQNQNETDKMKDFFNDQFCFACDKDLSRLMPEDIMHHCYSHSSDSIKFCDRCGLDKSQCNELEIINHQEVCVRRPARYDGEKDDEYCGFCGLDTTNETADQRARHRTACPSKADSGYYCTRCSLSFSNDQIWTPTAIATHNDHCKPPRGYKRKFCVKCQQEFSKLDDNGRAAHQRNCFLKESAESSVKQRIQGTLLKSFTVYTSINKTPDLRKLQKELYEKEKELRIQSTIIEHRTANLGETSVADSKPMSQLDGFVPCPYSRCEFKLAGKTLRELVQHFLVHSKITPRFTCPLEDHSGTTCKHNLSLENDAFDLTTHYVHKHSDAERKDIEKRGNEVSANFKALRDLMEQGKLKAQENQTFIAERAHLLSRGAKAEASSKAGQGGKKRPPPVDTAQDVPPTKKAKKTPPALTLKRPLPADSAKEDAGPPAKVAKTKKPA